MKTTIFYGAAAFTLLTALTTGCADGIIETSGYGNEVISYKSAFGQSQSADTRSQVLLTETIMDGRELDVWAYFSSGSEQNGMYYTTKLKYLDTASPAHWSYNNDVDINHPIANLTHYSVYPMTNVTTAETGKLDNVDAATAAAEFDYTVPATAAEQEDLLAARAVTTKANPEAAFTYRHLLSQINFSVKGYPGVKITISDIKMGGLYNKGTFVFPLNPGGWKNLSGTAGYDYEIQGPVGTDPANLGKTDGANDDEILFGNYHVGGVKVNSLTNSLMLLPQSFDSADEGYNADAYFTFDYVLNNVAGGTEVGRGNDVKVFLKDVDIDGKPAWLPGHRYRYTLRFNKLATITYTVTAVAEWETGLQGNVNN